jgi:hypothetical protein
MPSLNPSTYSVNEMALSMYISVWIGLALCGKLVVGEALFGYEFPE